MTQPPGNSIDYETYIAALEQTVGMQAIRIAQLEALVAQLRAAASPHPNPSTPQGTDDSSTLDMAVEVEEGKGDR